MCQKPGSMQASTRHQIPTQNGASKSRCSKYYQVVPGFSHFLATSRCCSCLQCFQTLMYPHKPNDSSCSAVLPNCPLHSFNVPSCVRQLRRTAAWLLRRLLGQRTWSNSEVNLLSPVVLCCANTVLSWMVWRAFELTVLFMSVCIFWRWLSRELFFAPGLFLCTLLSYLRSFKDDEQIGSRRELLV